MDFIVKTLARGLCAAALLLAAQAAASQPQVLYRFTGQGDGGDPAGALVLDARGDLYGLASRGGTGDAAVIYALRRAGGGVWKEAVIHDFPPPAAGEMAFPSLTIDRDGALLGSLTQYPGGSGDVFRLTPPAATGASWAYQVLAHFPGSASPLGDFLAGGLFIDRKGAIFGVTQAGGDESGAQPCDCGLVYSLTRPAGPGPWPETVLSVFHSLPDGNAPYAGLTLGPDGALFGTTYLGGAGKCLDGSGVVVVGCGTLFTLTGASGAWTRTTLHSFRQADPTQPTDTLTLGPDGALYGFDTLVAYRIAPPGVPGGRWIPSVIHQFPGGITGTSPVGAPVFDAKGDIYGITRSFGLDGPVVLFRLSRPRSNPNGAWSETELFRLGSKNFADQPAGGIVRAPDGALYGAIGAGAQGSLGYVFAFKP